MTNMTEDNKNNLITDSAAADPAEISNDDAVLTPEDAEDLDQIFGFAQFDDFSVESLLVDMGAKRHSPTLYRDEIINQIMAILISLDKPNALLVGPAGSGKTNIVEEFAYRISDPQYSVPQKLREYRVYSLNLSDIVSGSGLVGDLERKVKGLITYLEDPEHKAILFLDEIHMLFSGETYKKVAQMLKPALSRGNFKVVAATTTQEVKKVEEDPAFNRRFTRVLVDELTVEQTTDIVEKMIPVMQKHYGVRIRSNADIPETIVRIADEFCQAGSHRPDNALTLLDRAIANNIVSQNRKSISLTRQFIEDTAYRMVSGNSQVKHLDEGELRRKLSVIHGQDQIIEEILKVLILHDMHVRPRTRPLTFLFAGPSGVGKSEIAKIIASEYIGEKPIVLNMTEYSSSASINRITGAPAGFVGYDSNSELPFDRLDTNPYQLIILDEFEKCDRSVQRLFMSVFDEGVMKTNVGKEVDFSKSIIIATTNAGCTAISGSVGFGSSKDRNSNLTISDLSEYFDVELLNRFSHKLTFKSIDQRAYAQIVKDTFLKEVSVLDKGRLNNDIKRKLKDAAKEALEHLAASSYQPQLGARPARTVVTEYIDGVLLDSSKKKPARHAAYEPAYERG
ncbi:MAG: AAA family ATPase [Lachnospiraceae bacterium]|nr:AAA family ATPase [Lachnospiraceae bacterium]